MYNHIRAQKATRRIRTHRSAASITNGRLDIKMHPFLKAKRRQKFFKNTFAPVALNLAIVLKCANQILSRPLRHIVRRNRLL